MNNNMQRDPGPSTSSLLASKGNNNQLEESYEEDENEHQHQMYTQPYGHHNQEYNNNYAHQHSIDESESEDMHDDNGHGYTMDNEQQQHQQQQYQMQMQMHMQQQMQQQQHMYQDDEEDDNTRQHHGQQANNYMRNDDDDDDEDEMDDMDEDHDESSELELPEAEEDIDYDIVYALHTFLATVEGQASVVKGDQLTLLDDSNSYWWLVRVLKTQLVGYIPAENIETPEERLARFYKKQNLLQARAKDTDIQHGAISARRARAHFKQPHHPTNKMYQEMQKKPKVQLNPELAGGGRFVDFGPPSFQEFTAYVYSDDETDASMEDGEDEQHGDGDFEDEEEEGSDGSFEGGSLEDDDHAHARALARQQTAQSGFVDDHTVHAGGFAHNDQRSYSDIDDGNAQNQYIQQPTGFDSANNDPNFVPFQERDTDPSSQQGQGNQPMTRQQQAKAQAALGVANGGRPVQHGPGSDALDQPYSANTPTLARKLSVDDRLRVEREGAQNQGGGASRLKAFAENTRSSSPTASNESETKKISLTPRIAREDSTDSNLSDFDAGSQPHASANSHLQVQPQRQPLRVGSNASSTNADISNVSSSFSAGTGGRNTPNQREDQSHFRRGSAGSATSSVNSALSAGSSQKRGASPAGTDSSSSKKKKAGGILGGLFSRNKKDKKEDKEKEKDKDKDKSSTSRRPSESTSEDERASLTNSPAPESPEQAKGRASPSSSLASQQVQQKRAQQQVKEEMFGTEAALRQQQVEAQNVMYQNYGINPRAPGDTVNTSTFSATISPPTSASESSHHTSSGQHGNLHQTSMALSPSTSSMQSSVSGNVALTGRQLRPGSLIGSPHMTGSGAAGDVPVLNVLRVFAGNNIIADASFKTVLLNELTSTEDLVKQAMQRFRLDPPVLSKEGLSPMETILQEYYLSAKEADGEETRLQPGQRPLKIFEGLTHAAGFLQPGQGLPSVKRSSVGSISSISSTLSTNPAIEKLRMSDFSDDSNVKLYINRRHAPSRETTKRDSDGSSTGTITGRRMSDDLRLDAKRLSGISMVERLYGDTPASPLVRFAVKIVIHPSDLPDSMAFDPFSQSLIAKSALPDRERQSSRSPSMSSLHVPSTHREKILFFPRNANVSEILETALDRFGIVEGVVDGGDDIDSKILKRRSMSRIRYCLAAIHPAPHNEEKYLNPSSKILDVYSQPPMFKPYERNSKEFRRRSMETHFNAPSAADLQGSDPVFVIRKAMRTSLLSNLASSLRSREDLHSDSYNTERSASRSSQSNSVYATPIAEIPPSLERAVSPQQAKQEIIAAQRAASRANQRAMISAQKNEKQGVDVVLADSSMIRSSRDGFSTRYSYIAADGASEIDISEIVENEWRSESHQGERAGSTTPIPPRESPSALSLGTSESYTSALASPLTPAANLPGYLSLKAPVFSQGQDEEEREALERVNAAELNYDGPEDYLEQALQAKRVASPASQGHEISSQSSINEKLDRVLAKVRGTGASPGPAGVASALRSQQQMQYKEPYEPSQRLASHSVTNSIDSGRSTPATVLRSGSAASDRGPSYVSQMMRARSGSTGSNGRYSPGPQILERLGSLSARSTPQPEAPPTSGSSTPRRPSNKSHIKRPSMSSIASDGSSVLSASPSTPATVSAGNTTSTPVSSTRNDSSRSTRLPIPYREDLGLAFLMHLVHLESGSSRIPRQPKLDILDILNNNNDFPQLSPELAALYDKPRQRLDDLDKRLDLLLSQVMRS